MRKLKVKIPLYFGELHIFQTDKWSKVNKKYNLGLPEEFLTGRDGIGERFHHESGYTRYYILVHKDVTHSVIAHEVAHIVNHIFEDRGIYLDTGNDEPQTYLTGWITKQCYSILKNVKNK